VCNYRPFAATRAGMMMAIALNSCKPHQFNFFQVVNGIQMWRSAASNEVCILNISDY